MTDLSRLVRRLAVSGLYFLLVSAIGCGGGEPSVETECQSDGDCADGETCSPDGECRQDTGSCEEGEQECDGTCVDVASDTQHCGACGNNCDSNQVCSNGTCTCSAETCTTDVDGAQAHCDDQDVCQIECTDAERSLCGGETCVDTTSDDDHCGGCDVSCEDDETCDNGECQSTDPSGCDPTAEPFGAGEGTADEPYQICSIDQFDRIDADPDYLGRHYELSADITAGESFGGVALESEDAFEGTLDGNGHIIEGLTIDETPDDFAPADEYAGLFGRVVDGVITDLILEDVDITGNDKVGALAGGIVGDTARIEGVEVTGSVSVSGRDLVGGLVGSAWADVVDSHVTATSGSVEGTERVGGITGDLNAVLERSTTDVDVVSEVGEVGGAVGVISHLGSNTEIRQTTASGNISVTGEGNWAGGLVGTTSRRGEVRRSKATGDVEGEETRYVGGLIGEHGNINQPDAALVEDSYATGDTLGSGWVGGLVGHQEAGEISRCYSTGESTANAHDGGLIGEINDEGTESDSYWNIDSSGTEESAGGTGLTGTEFGDPSSFSGWDFDDVWTMGADRPLLQWE